MYLYFFIPGKYNPNLNDRILRRKFIAIKKDFKSSLLNKKSLAMEALKCYILK